jgi:N utilization substance protein A
LDSAKSVLALSHEELVRRTDLEDDTIQEIVRILQSEFE